MSEHLDRMDRERVMSESSARAERRDLRRAMGPHVQAFASDTKQAIQTLQAGIQTLHEQTDALRTHAQAWAFEQHERVAIGEMLCAFLARGLIARLRWLLFGR